MYIIIIYNYDIIDGVHMSRTAIEREVHWYEQQGKKKWDEHGMLSNSLSYEKNKQRT